VPNVAQAWRETTQRFRAAKLHYGHGTHNARDEAAWLICHVLKVPFGELAHALGRTLSATEQRRLQAVVGERVETRIPLAYLLHEAWLGSYRFYVDRRVIVPRSFIAELIPQGIAPWIVPQRVKRILDLCTGSGCLAILAALAYPEASVDAADISAPALAVAQRNVRTYGLETRVRLIRSNLFTELVPESYDLIISNPPYVSDRSMCKLPAEYRHEPTSALAGGRGGLDCIVRILHEAPGYLSSRGELLIELGHNRNALERAYPRLPVRWLATSAGDGLVFMIGRSALQRALS
jgi:ribosomal protein L3 glutamine methyltransferase